MTVFLTVQRDRWKQTMEANEAPVTALLARWRQGDQNALELLTAALYDQLLGDGGSAKRALAALGR